MQNTTTLVAGIRASGKLHIGHYLGLVKQLLESQNNPRNNCFYFIADLHGLTTPIIPGELAQHTLEIASTYLALGIDPNKITFFAQNHVHEHSELAWIFNCITPLGELERMTQFKDKARQHEKHINAGLLTYPCLMGADILLYKPTAIPIGEDQIQHVELARVIARKFNHQFGETFPEPKPYLREPLRIMSLTDPTKKMSKTGDEALNLDDTPEEILKKLKKAVTATEAGQKSPGEENLMQLLTHFGTADESAHYKKQQANGTLKYSELKETLAKNIATYFAEFREKKTALLSKPENIKEILMEGAKKAKLTASKTLQEVKQKIGLL